MILHNGLSHSHNTPCPQNMANDAKKAVSHMTSQSLILGMDLKELNEYAYTTTFLQLAHQSFDESNRRARADLGACCNVASFYCFVIWYFIISFVF